MKRPDSERPAHRPHRQGRHRPAAAVIVVLLAALAGVLFWWGDESGPLAPFMPGSVADPGAGRPDPGHASRTATGEGARGFLAEDPGRDRPGVLVQIVGGPRDLPLRGVSVAHLRPFALPESERDLAWKLHGSHDLDGLAPEVFRTATDDRGLARVPWARQKALVVADHKDQVGHAWVHPGGEQPVRIRLAPRRRLRVQALGPDEKPVGSIAVALGVEGELRDRWRGLTDQRSGDVEVPLPPDVDPRKVRVRAALPLPEPVSASLSDAGSVVYLRLPALAKARIRVDGASRPAVVAVGQAGAQSVALAANRPFLADQDGIVIAPVGLGLELVAELSGDGMHEPGQVRFAGPREAGETVDVVVTRGRPYPAIRARVLDPARRPWPATRVRAEIESRGDDRVSAVGDVLLTSSDGTILLPVRTPLPEGRDHALVVALLDPFDGTLRGLGRALLPRALAPGVHDAGDLLLEAVPVLATGQVTDPQGRPVQGAVVAAVAVADDLSEPVFLESADEVGCDEEGRFELRGIRRGSMLRLVARAQDGIPSEEAEVPCGARGVRIVLASSGVIEGKVIVDEGLDPSALELRVRPLRSTSGAPLARANPDGEGRFRISRVPIGVHEVEAVLPEEDATVAELAPVHVQDAGGSRDERLLAWDLRGLFAGVEVRVVDARGDPIPGAFVRQRPKDSEGREYWSRLESGQGTLLTRHGALVLLAAAPGYRPARAETAEAVCELVLERGIEVPFEVVSGGGPPRTRAELFVRWAPLSVPPTFAPSLLGSPASACFAPEVRIGEDGRGTVRLPWHGKYRLLWSLGTGPLAMSSGSALVGREPDTVEVGPDPGGASMTFDIAPEVLRETERGLVP